MSAILRVRDENGNIIDIPAIVGPKGETGPQGDKGDKGDKGDPGNDYIFTDTDKQEIISAVLNARPTANAITETVSGDPIVLSDSSDDYIRSMKLFGKTKQFTTTGKNLVSFDGLRGLNSTKFSNGVIDNQNVITINTSTSSSPTMATVATQWMNVPMDGTYTFSAYLYAPKSAGFRIVVMDNSYNNITAKVVNNSLTGWQRLDTTCSLSKDVTLAFVIQVHRSAENEDVDISFNRCMVEYDESVTEYEPYTGGIPSPNPDYPQELESVGDDGNISVTVVGKNLLPNNLTTQTISGVTFTIGEDGTITANGTATATDLADVYLYGQAKDNDNYLFVPKGTKFVGAETAQSFFIFREKTAGAVVGGSVINPILAERDCYFYGILFRVSPNATVSNFSSKPMLYKQTYSNEYEPYKEPQTLSIPTPNELPGIPVSSGGNYTDENGQRWICDEIDFARGKYVQRIGKEALKGTPTFEETPSRPGRFAWYRCLSNLYKGGDNIGKSNFAIWKAWGSPSDGQTVFSQSTNSLYFSPKDAMTADAVNAMFAEMIASDNPPIIIGQLETPIETDLTAEEIAQYSALHTNYPNTTVYNDEGAGMTVKYVADTKLYIDKKFTELQNAILSAGANV